MGWEPVDLLPVHNSEIVLSSGLPTAAGAYQILREDGPDLFVHFSAVPGSCVNSLAEGDKDA